MRNTGYNVRERLFGGNSMNKVDFRVYGELNSIIWKNHGEKDISIQLESTHSVKDLVESLGIPHGEVGLLLVDGEVEDFGRKLHGGERVSVYPVFRSIEVAQVSKTLLEYPKPPRFILDVHLGKLARYLRMLGFDTIYEVEGEDSWLADKSEAEGRVLLSFDRELLMRKKVPFPYLVRSRYPLEQLREVVERFGLFDQIEPLTRCMVCNGVLEPVDKEEIIGILPKGVAEINDIFKKCDLCGKVYWSGTHTQGMDKIIENLRHDICNGWKVLGK